MNRWTIAWQDLFITRWERRFDTTHVYIRRTRHKESLGSASPTWTIDLIMVTPQMAWHVLHTETVHGDELASRRRVEDYFERFESYLVEAML